MSVFKNAHDVLEVAVRIEREGEAFYRALSKNAPSDPAREALAFLADEEKKHAQKFSDMLDDLVDYTPQADYPGEYGIFIRETARLSIEAFRSAPPATDYIGALRLGIQTELQTIVFFTEITKDAALPHREVVDRIVEEEKKHLLRLTELRDLEER